MFISLNFIIYNQIAIRWYNNDFDLGIFFYREIRNQHVPNHSIQILAFLIINIIQLWVIDYRRPSIYPSGIARWKGKTPPCIGR